MKRFNETTKGYKYDKLIFWGLFLFWAGIFFYIFYLNGFDTRYNFYFVCDDLQGCPNPLDSIKCSNGWLLGSDCHIKCTFDWCGKDIVPYGTYGNRAPGYFKYLGLFTLLSFILAVVLNHYIHNKGKSFDIEIRISEKKRLRPDKYLDKLDEKLK